MPLTLSLYGTSPKSMGHVIIDRNNLIFTYEKNAHGEYEAAKNREGIIAAIVQIDLSNYLSKKQSFADTPDPRHDALEHMSTYDQYHCTHCHLIFNVDISMDHIQYIFNHPAMAKIPYLISNTCRLDILDISKNYFLDLKQSEAAQKIEENYRQEKQVAFENATREATSYQDDDSTSTRHSLDANLSNHSLALELFFLEKMLDILSALESSPTSRRRNIFNLFSPNENESDTPVQIQNQFRPYLNR